MPNRFPLTVAFAIFAVAGIARAEVTEEAKALEKAVDQAVTEGRYGRAAALLRGLETLVAPSPEPGFRLGEVYALAGQYDQAIDSYRRYAATTSADPAKRQRAN